ncbi:DUF1365 domain-containing protein [Methylohalobius crimeensis]|uniref:DUF1365 domain-containing protein n=1 Tax=Methylohalobius crimeensis TaxID=244365 RepID=UPI0003B5166C|nr:DUF1365 domain-containing protein [Methylohalobius crimeensis]
MREPHAASLYYCSIMHARRFPVRYRFRYRLFSLLLDLDALPQYDRKLKLFGYNRPAPVAFYDRDHGPRDGRPLRPWIDQVLEDAGIGLAGGEVSLLTLPRLWGYVFNPLSLWYCRHRDGSLRAVLAEVHNTFGEWHGYLLHEQGRPIQWPLCSKAAKCFHVSPFIGMEAVYHFRLSEPTERLQVSIQEYQEDRLMLIATQSGRREALTDRALLRALCRFPLATFKVILMIHWQALKLWLQKIPLYHKPEPPDQEVGG